MKMALNIPSESQSLLRNEAAGGEDLAQAAAKQATPARSLRVVIPGIVMLFLSEWCSVFIRVSMGALMERAICQRQYPNVVDSLHDPQRLQEWRCPSRAVHCQRLGIKPYLDSGPPNSHSIQFDDRGLWAETGGPSHGV